MAIIGLITYGAQKSQSPYYAAASYELKNGWRRVPLEIV